MGMFSSNTNGNGRARDGAMASLSPSSPSSGGKRGMFSVLGADVVVTGNIAATADLHIDGRVEGDVSCGALVQGTESKISGNLYAETARIAGTIDGTVSVRQLLVERTARINGDVEYESITIENGASIDGRLKHITPESGKSFSRLVSEPLLAKSTADAAVVETVHLITDSNAAA